MPDDLIAEGDEIVAGRRPVEEAFVAGREARRFLVVPQRRQALEKLVLHATGLRIPIVEVEGGTLTALTGFDGHQGVALVVAARRYVDPEEILARAIERDEPAFILVLDSLEDPHNVGTLLRSAEAAAAHGVIFPTRRQAPLTPAAVKASAGAVEHLLLAPVDDLPASLADLHGRGLRIVGADAEATLTVREADLRGPLALVVGSEGQGLGPAVRRRCDLLVRIPMRGAVGSLNASVAGSILLYEASTQRGGATAPPAGHVAAGDPAVPPVTDDGPVETPPADAELPPVGREGPDPTLFTPDAAAPDIAPAPKAPRLSTGKIAPKPPKRARKIAAATATAAGVAVATSSVELGDRSLGVEPPRGDELLPGGRAAVVAEPSTEATKKGAAGRAPAAEKATPKPPKLGRKTASAGAKTHKGKSKAKGAAADRG